MTIFSLDDRFFCPFILSFHSLIDVLTGRFFPVSRIFLFPRRAFPRIEKRFTRCFCFFSRAFTAREIPLPLFEPKFGGLSRIYYRRFPRLMPRMFVECEETKDACKYGRREFIARGLRAIQFGPRLGEPSSAKSAQPLAKSSLQN